MYKISKLKSDDFLRKFISNSKISQKLEKLEIFEFFKFDETKHKFQVEKKVNFQYFSKIVRCLN